MLLRSRLPTGVNNTRQSPLRAVTSTRVCSRQAPTARCAAAQWSHSQRRTALVARFRNGGDTAGPDASSEPGASTGDDATLVPVVFELCKHCSFGHTFALVGDAPQLGDWDVGKALKLEWSEGDVWQGTVSLPLDSPVCFKYVQVDGSGGLVAWGQDIAGGSNMSVLVSASDEVTSGLQLVLDPPEAADSSQQPYLVARLDTTATLPDSAAAAAAGADASLAVHGDGVSLSTDEEDDMHALAAEPSADYDDSTPPQLLQQEEAGGQNWGGWESGAGDQQQQLDPAGGVEEAGTDTTSESVQEAGLEIEAPAAQLAADEGWANAAAEARAGAVEASFAAPLAAAAGLDASSAGVNGADAAAAFAAQALPEAAAVGESGLGVSAGGLSAGFEDAGSMGAAVASGLMEAGDDETTAGPIGTPAPTATSATPAVSDSSSGVQSFMITSADLDESASDTDLDTTGDVSSIVPDSVIDITPMDLNTEELLQATAQDSARLATTHEASAGEAAATSTPSNDSRGGLEGVPTPGDSNEKAAVWDAMLGAKELTVPEGEAAGCRPPNPDTKLVGATASIATLDPDAPLQEPAKAAITELDSSVEAVQPVDNYEGVFEALTAAAAVAATSSMDGHDHGREGSAAKGEREVQLVSAEQETATAGGDAEGTGTWTGGATAADSSSSSSGAEPAQRATEGGQEASAVQEGTSSKKQLNWFQRLLGGRDEDERA